MPEPAANYYEMFPEISPEMRAEDIRRALEKKSAVLANRFDEKSLTLQDQVEAALGVFWDEAGKQAYDRALAQSGQKQPEEDPLQKQREELEHWRSRARSFYDGKEFDLAKPAIERALALEMSRDDSKLYLLAAHIYNANGDHDTALRYINEAIVLEPEAIELTMHKAEICFGKAGALAKRPGFQNDLPLQEEYRSVRTKGFELLDAVSGKAKEAEVEEEDSPFAEIVGMQACELYFRPDTTDAEQAAREKKEGLRKARVIESGYYLNDDDKVTLVLKEEKRKKDERAVWKERARKHFDEGEYTQAKDAIERALAIDLTEHSDADDADLYNLAASIYYSDGIDNDTALGYIDQALALEPDDVDHNTLQGAICGTMAVEISDYSSFRSSSKWQSEYTRLRSLGLKSLRKAVSLGQGKCRNAPTSKKYKEQYAEALDTLAYYLYYKSDALNATKAREEKKEAMMHARRVLELVPDGDMEARNILKWEDREKSERSQWKKRAREYYDKNEWKQAQNAISKALDIDLAEPSDKEDAYLYWLAASIYYLGNIDCDTALGYINKALALEPDNVYDTILKGRILGRKALRLANSGSFGSSSGLRQQYRALRDQELAAFNTACDRAKAQYQKAPDNSGCKSQLASALGHLGYALYFRADRLDGQKAPEERRKGVELAQEAQTCRDGSVWYIQEVLDDDNKKMEEIRSFWAAEHKKTQASLAQLEAEQRRNKKRDLEDFLSIFGL